jgi:hypothetical protein
LTEQTVSTRVTVTVGAESYVFDRDALTLTDLYQIKSASGLDLNPFLEGIGEGNPVSLQTLVWFLRHKAGIQCDRTAVEFTIGEFDMAPVVEPDPTAASSEPSAIAISDASPTTAI